MRFPTEPTDISGIGMKSLPETPQLSGTGLKAHKTTQLVGECMGGLPNTATESAVGYFFDSILAPGSRKTYRTHRHRPIGYGGCTENCNRDGAAYTVPSDNGTGGLQNCRVRSTPGRIPRVYRKPSPTIHDLDHLDSRDWSTWLTW